MQTLERPSTSPSPRQSYFERYPTRTGKGKEKEGAGGGLAVTPRVASGSSIPVQVQTSTQADQLQSSIDGMASARAKAARERAKALNSRLSSNVAAAAVATVRNGGSDGRPSPSPSAGSSQTPSPAIGPVAFPTVDDEDDREKDAGFDDRRELKLSSVSAHAAPTARIVPLAKGHHREKSAGGVYRSAGGSSSGNVANGVGGGYLGSSSKYHHLPRSQAFNHLPSSSTGISSNYNFPSSASAGGSTRGGTTPDLLPFIRTSTSSTYTQTTFADQDPEFIPTPLSTPKSSLYRADGVLVAGLSAGVGVETMDALVQGMNNGTSTDETDYPSSMVFGRRGSKDKRAGKYYALHGHHPLYHPPLPQPPDGVSLGTPKGKGKKEREREESTSTATNTEDEALGASNPASASVSSSEKEKDYQEERERERDRDKRTGKISSGNGPPSFHYSHRDRPTTAKSDVTIKHSSRGSTAGLFDDVEPPTRKAHSRPTTREKDRDRDRPRSSRHRVRGSRDYHHHHQRKHQERSSSSAASSPRSDMRDLPPPPPPPAVDLASPVVEAAPKPATVVPSISDIIRAHAPAYAAANARPKRAVQAPPSSFTGLGLAAGSGSRRSSLAEADEEEGDVEEEEVTGRSSIDSVAAEVRESLRKSSTARYAPGSRRTTMEKQSRESSDDYDDMGSRRLSITSPTVPHKRHQFPPVAGTGRKTLQHAKSFGDRPRSVVVVGSPTTETGPGLFSPTNTTTSYHSYKSPRSEGGAHSAIGMGYPGGVPPRPASRSASVYSGPAPSLAPSTPLSLGTPGITFTGGNVTTQDPTKLELAQFLRSPRLTRLMTLRRHPHAGLTVSLADVGSPTGHPVLVYLGLGCVRYLIALYDEMAEALGLRLVCVDRWGLGRTGEPTTENGRGLLEWAAVMEEVADTLGLEMYSVVAHSAGAPYALAGVLKCGERRVKGSVHLLAPWVSMSVDTGYKWLKYVPNGLIKTAQAAEWKVQGWMLGKPPTITYQGIEYDANAAAAAEQEKEKENELHRTLSPPADVRSSLSTSSYDDLGDFDGKYESSSTLGRRAAARQGGSAGKSGKKKPVKSILSIFNNNAGAGGAGGSAPSSGHTSKANSTRSSRANSLAGGASVKTLPGPGQKRSPKLKGLKSLSSLRVEAGGLDVARHASDPALASGLMEHPHRRPYLPSHQSQPEVAMSGAVTSKANVGLGIGLDDEMMEWGARLKMLEEISPPTPPGSASGKKGSGRASSTDGSRGRRSVSLTGGRPAYLKDIVPPVPPLPSSPCLSVDQPHSPNAASITSSNGTGSTAVAPRKAPMSLANALLRASHAESLKGGTADLMAILERDSKPWGFSYADVKHSVKVWYGDRDEKIAISSIRWMERVMKDCTVTIVKGGNHSLLTNADVVVEVLESIAKEWNEDPPVSPDGFRPPLVSASTSSLHRKRAWS